MLIKDFDEGYGKDPFLNKVQSRLVLFASCLTNAFGLFFSPLFYLLTNFLFSCCTVFRINAFWCYVIPLVAH